MHDDPVDSEFLTYWEDAARPLTSLAFILPMLLIYEGGLVFLGPQALRNGADVWLRQILDFVGFGQYFLLPTLTCGLLLAWHHVSHERWLLRSGVLQGMLVEAFAFGALLLLVARTHASLITSIEMADRNISTTLAIQQLVPNSIAYFGAGVYEELLFRLMLLPLLVWLLHGAGLTRLMSYLGAAILSSVLFSIVHYEFELNLFGDFVFRNHGEPLVWSSFSFRLLAGGFFSFLFLHRGFGIAAGAHAIYDILTVIQ